MNAVSNFEEENNDYLKPNAYCVKVTGGTLGRVVDLGIDDEANMGAAMAPAALFKSAPVGTSVFDAWRRAGSYGRV